MERKVIQQNTTTLVISLPKKWVNKNDIKKGDPLSISEQGFDLVISKLDSRKKSLNPDLSEIEDNRVIRIILNNLYRKGFDELEIKVSKSNRKQILTLIHDQRYIGWEVFSEKSGFLKISTFAEPTVERADSLFGKLISILREEIGTLNKLNEHEKTYSDSVERYYQFLRRHFTKEKVPPHMHDLLRTLLLIQHAIDRLKSNSISYSNNELLFEISEFFNLVYGSFYNKKVTFAQTQKKYLLIEKKILSSSKKGAPLLWEIVRNINLASAYIESISHDL